MPKTVTLRLNESIYRKIRDFAEQDNRPLSNFIETATMRYMEQIEYVDDFEMDEIIRDISLNQSIKKGIKDAKLKRGRFIDL
ncbi:MAG: CopG family transcriptional regulator [bacterium]